jgi:hypothetical protein
MTSKPSSNVETVPPSLRAVALYLGLYLLTTVIVFRAGSFVPKSTGYVLLVSLFVIPLGLSERGHLTPAWEVFFLFATPLLPMLIVIDPFEAGLFGYDAYSFTIPALDYLRNGASIGSFVNADGDWPAFYAVVLAFQQLAGVDTGFLSKYFPLFVVVIPFIVYAGVELLATRRIAFYTGMAVASTRTLVLFEIKFVDETIAILLFFTAIVYLALSTRERQAVVGLSVVITALALTHHATSAFFSILLACTLGASLVKQVPLPGLLARRLYPQRGRPIDVGITGTIVVAFGIGAVFLFLAPQVTTELVNTAHGALFEGQQTAAPAQSGSGGGIFSVSGVPPRQLVSRAAILVFALMAGVTAFGVLTRYDAAYWEVGWVGAAGIFAILYFASLVGGRVVPLDPIRILLFLVATITPPTLSVISRVGLPPRLSQLVSERPVFTVFRGLVAVLVVSTLILTQVAAFTPHVLYTNPDETVIGEGHHTSAQFGASQWTERHYSGAVLGAERSLWVAHDNNYRNPTHGKGACKSLLTVWRPETGDTRPADVSVVFDSTGISLTQANTEPYIPGKASNTQASPNYNSGPPECGTFVRSKFAKANHTETS